MASVETLRRRRRTAVRKLDACMTNRLQAIGQKSPSREEVNVFLNEVKELKGKVKEPHEELEELTEDQDLQVEIDFWNQVDREVLSFERKCFEAVAVGEAQTNHNTGGQNTNAVPVGNTGRSHIKLPEIQLPKFAGDVENWVEFWDQFRIAVHENAAVPGDVQKFVYLKSFLQGTALAAVEGYKVTSANYAAAIAVLKARYGKPHAIVEAHVSALLDLPQKSYADATNLCELRNMFETRIRSLAASGRDADKNEIPAAEILVPIFKKKLPAYTRKRWETKIVQDGNTSTTVKAFLDFLSQEIEIEEAMHGIKPHRKDFKFGEKVAKGEDRRYLPSATAALHTKVDKVCPFCSDTSHDRVDTCPAFSQIPAEKRYEEVRKKNLCTRCLRFGHYKRSCLRQKGCSKCGKDHNTLLHLNEDQMPVQVKATSQDRSKMHATPKEGDQEALTSYFVQQPQEARLVPMLQTAKAFLVTPEGRSFPVRCLFDTGSQRSFVERKLADDLGLKGPSEKVILSTLSDEKPKVSKMMSVKFGLKGQGTNANEKAIKLSALAVRKIRPVQVPMMKAANLSHLTNLRFADDFTELNEHVTTLKIDVIIGADSYWDCFTTNVIKGSPTAMESIFGWVLGGTCGESPVAKVSCYRTDVLTSSEERIWKDFCDFETLGIKDGTSTKETVSDEVYEEFKKSIEFKEGRYHVSIPWKEESSLPNNYWVAKKRFLRQEVKLQEDEERAKQYKAAMKEYEDLGFVEEVDSSSSRYIPDHVWYLPHSAVFKEERETTKCRVVFDGSSKCEGVSINSKIHTGPRLQPSIVGVILRFRRWKIGITADIKKMFLQICVKDEDRDAMRYLWRDNPDESIRIMRFIKIIFGMNVSPFLSIGTVKVHAERSSEAFPEAFSFSTEVDENMYVDDFLSGKDDLAEATKFVADSVKMMASGGFPLVKFVSNVPDCLNEIPDTHKSGLMSKPLEERQTKVLGVKWDLAKDVMSVSWPKVSRKAGAQVTKRHVLKCMASVFDPMGWVSPYIMQAKILFSHLWKIGCGWDDDIPSDLQKRWNVWETSLPLLEKVEIPRRMRFLSNMSKNEIHGFGDASEEGYRSVVYLRFEEAGQVRVSFLTAKSRIAPAKDNGGTTIPKLELMAALVTARLVKFVKEELFADAPVQVYGWSDSQVALQWIAKKDPVNQFVKNRVQEIVKVIPPCSWSHCLGKVNPADRISRGQTLESLIKDTDWWEGPTWMKQELHESWAPVSTTDDKGDTCWSSGRRNKNLHSQEPLKKEKQEVKAEVGRVVALATFVRPLKKGGYFRFLKIIAFVNRFVTNCRSDPVDRKTGPILFTEVKKATQTCVKVLQNEHYGEEVKRLRNKEDLPKSSQILKFDPFLDEEGIVRVGGRLQNAADLSYDQRCPILIPRQANLARFVVEESHVNNQHCGAEQVLSDIRQKFWIPKPRSLIRGIIHKCLACRKESGKMQQKMGNLPRERVTVSRPFANVGVDFAGPIYLATKGRTEEKAYICLFTCMASRAVHLEVVSNLTTEVFLLALRRMTSRRGKCEIFWSDNALTFKSAHELLKQAAEHVFKESPSQMAKEGIKWKFIPEGSPWWGGMYERLIRSVKTALRKVLGNASLNYEEMTTVLCEVECQVNSRPLTTVSTDAKDPEPLTPAHLLLGSSLSNADLFQVNSKLGGEKVSLQARWRHRQRLASQFWNRWRNEYLVQLQQRNKWQQAKKNIKAGDVVLIENEMQSRGKWLLGVISDVTKGRDGLTRSALVRTSKGPLRRSVQRLHLLESTDDDPPPGENVTEVRK